MSTRSDDNLNYVEEKQGEFFSEFNSTSEKKPGNISRYSHALRKKTAFSISYENLVFASIIVIMLMVVFFSLGVEKGKRVKIKNYVAATAEPFDSTKEKEVSAALKEIGAEISKPEDVNKPSGSGIAEPEIGNAAIPGKPYTIQVVAYKNEKNAKNEIEQLKAEGYDAFILPSKEWFQVCVGRYANKEESKKDFDTLRNRYPTSYFRRIEKN